MDTHAESPRPLLAYFSHSYRPRRIEKDINLYFWELLSKQGLYFTVDAEVNKSQPMDITYLEWMMQRSACFVAVIPWRDDSSPYNCSPYQIFENGLAIRAKKPRLVFVEAGLDATRIGVESDEVFSFRRRQEWLEADKDKFTEAAIRLAKRAHVVAAIDNALEKPVALVADINRGTAYSNSVVRTIGRTVNDLGFYFEIVNPTEFEQDFLLLRKVEQYSLLISEIRQPYLTPDTYGLLHGRCLPTIRVCHLDDSEDPEEAKSLMHLSSDITAWTDQSTYNFPLVLSRYEVDNAMHPVIFWKRLDELVAKITLQLRKIRDKRVDLIQEQEARDYFLQIGRLEGQVFISNAKAQNIFADSLKQQLTRNAIRFFHYKEPESIPTGSSNWLADITLEIKNSMIFLALVDNDYLRSRWCMKEMEEALDRFQDDEIEIRIYVLDENVKLPTRLEMMQADFIDDLEESQKIDRIVENSARFLETGKRVQLREVDHARVVNLLASFPSLATPEVRRALLLDSGLLDHIVDKVSIGAQTSERAAAEMVKDLAELEQNLGPHTRALGLVLSHLMGLTKSFSEQTFLAQIIRGYRLMPDIRIQIGPRVKLHKLNQANLHAGIQMKDDQQHQDDTTFDLSFEASTLDPSLYTLLAKFNALASDWQENLRIIGKAIAQDNAFATNLQNYQSVVNAGEISNTNIQFCFATDGPGLGIPFEWALIKDQTSPLCLNYPVRRSVLRRPETRLPLCAILRADAAIPLRVLLVASNTGGIEEVEHEIEDVYSVFKGLFARVGWPESNICKLSTQEATSSRIEREIKSGHYHVLHFAGHGDYDDRKPVLRVRSDTQTSRPEDISALTLRNWLLESELRFVYLSSCRSISSGNLDLAHTIRRFESMAQAMVEAHVPEVIGFVWPIEDIQSRRLAQRFYTEFIKRFDASVALYRARTFFDEDNRIWAAPILIQQFDL